VLEALFFVKFIVFSDGNLDACFAIGRIKPSHKGKRVRLALMYFVKQ